VYQIKNPVTEPAQIREILGEEFISQTKKLSTISTNIAASGSNAALLP